MRRRAEVAHYAVLGARNALRAACEASRESLAVADGLTIDPAEAREIRAAATELLRRVEAALAAAELAAQTSAATCAAVDRATISRFGVPVLPP